MSLLGRFFQFRENANPDTVKPFMDHLEDLRWTLVKMAISLVIGMGVCLMFRVELVQILQKPLRDIDPSYVSNLQVLGPFDSIIISFRLAFYAGIVVSFPALLYFVAQFVLPALTVREKKFLVPGIAMGFILFGLGVCFSYFFVLPQTMAFCFQDAKSLDWTLRPTATHYFAFVTHLTIALGLCFELPIVVLALNYLGFLSFDLMRRTRIYAVPLMMTLAAIIAPTPDPMTLLALGLPLVALYECCIWLAYLSERLRKKNEQATLPVE